MRRRRSTALPGSPVLFWAIVTTFAAELAAAGFCFTLVLLLAPTAGLPAVLAEAANPTADISDTPPNIVTDSKCEDWVAWLPPKPDPAVVLQVVNDNYINMERNFIRLMEKNSIFTRHNLFLICMDEGSVRFFSESLGIRCIPLNRFKLSPHYTKNFIWKLRVRVVKCLLEVGQVDVIMSDADALWLKDPAQELYINGSSPHLFPDVQQAIHRSSVVASRGSFPFPLGTRWGSTMCMGFILFRHFNAAGMEELLARMEVIALKAADDQVAINEAADQLGVVWDQGSEMRYTRSANFGTGTISSLPADEQGHPFAVTLLPHTRYPRLCNFDPISAETVVAHCAGDKPMWMMKAKLWSVTIDQ